MATWVRARSVIRRLAPRLSVNSTPRPSVGHANAVDPKRLAGVLFGMLQREEPMPKSLRSQRHKARRTSPRQRTTVNQSKVRAPSVLMVATRRERSREVAFRLGLSDPFLDEQQARILSLFLGHKLTGKHRLGVWALLSYVYDRCRQIQVSHGVPFAEAMLQAKAYIRALQPNQGAKPSNRCFRIFSTLTRQAAGRQFETLERYRWLYNALLPWVKQTYSQVKREHRTRCGELHLDEVARDLTEAVTERIEQELPDLLSFSRGDIRNVSRQWISSEHTLRPPHEVTRLLAAILSGLGERSLIHLERLLKLPCPGAVWRIPEWETEPARILAEAMHATEKSGCVLISPSFPLNPTRLKR